MIYSNEDIEKTRNSKKVDRRVYGGGYGIAKEWKELLSYLTYFDSYLKIDKKDILELMSNIRKSDSANQRENIAFLLSENARYSFKLNPSTENSFTKYKISRTCYAHLRH